jgi:hypothetical protein
VLSTRKDDRAGYENSDLFKAQIVN